MEESLTQTHQKYFCDQFLIFTNRTAVEAFLVHMNGFRESMSFISGCLPSLDVLITRSVSGFGTYQRRTHILRIVGCLILLSWGVA